MSTLDNSSSPSPVPSTEAGPATAGTGRREMDPLLKDLSEKKQSFRRNVVSLAAELKEVRSRLASQEQSFVRETLTRQEAECRAKKMEEEICRLHESLEERNGQLQASAFTAEKYLKELDDLRSQLSATQAIANTSAASAQSAQFQCLELLKELDEKNSSLKEHEDRVSRLGGQLDLLQKDLQARESSQKQLKDEVLRIEQDIMQAVAKAGASKDCELRKILDEVSPRNYEKINKLLIAKDEEIAKLRDEIKIMSAHWKHKTKELESQVSTFSFASTFILFHPYTIPEHMFFCYSFMSFNPFVEQLEKHRRADQELKKRVLKLEFCLQEARAQTRKLQRMGERRDKALKELRDQLATKQQAAAVGVEKQNFWESSGFKIVVSVSMLILVVVSKR
ncbi:nuclear envelope-associated protein 2-like isoform X1 [Malania oleifera]|uniref:nuclear envelope-associated protein 2-like isoform X1 n=1 Tax=Malania oleifera TaxID=397392 RepID=UPI0025AE3FD0|nr:nuclear envelope-associated protein 2-like isoform X1 [Malania oleifera]XP_057963123.1 nuclear envelope-associated protein 2-like isoform X1 [Malania oleifera]XP_057963124.1 nuclear envelope-associated protein 2-like isoform X1 [Malania oleifera]XP_057963125.1 nuclear envelope-associated protein 2-like isoform X1 [Malania oleifera]XP_057963126.1 nuclear envelope-associated protein 2-like isoform X1 [Malania oleifera]XP_057963127.1 nuclear envelope-associated protein 2-like isoform X1 [Malan